MEEVVKELSGHSGATVLLMRDKDKHFIRKINNVVRNHERLNALVGYVDVPKVYDYNGVKLDMEYIQGMDMKNWLLYNPVKNLNEFIVQSINTLNYKSVEKDYTDCYQRSLAWLDHDNSFPFSKQELINRLPKVLPQTMYHGDMTLENIIWGTIEDRFFFIDPVTVPYDSWVFDIAKMRQDLEGKWFLRYDPLMLDVKLLNIRNNLFQKFPIAFDDALYITMLLRVYLHCEKNSVEYNLIMKEVNRLWKY
jgi:hypothetical protein